MFVDKVQVKVKAGDGGDGALSFRREKFVDRGGPDGGDGGDGGDVIFIASNNQDTLANFRYQKELKAEPGKPGFKRRKHGKRGQDLEVAVPVGTVVYGEDGMVLADLVSNNQREVIAKGGKGGFGNAHFVSSTRQAPRLADKGERGDELTLTLELKMIADVGLVGLPNAGKSTFLSVVSNAQPDIADYPFTTLSPNLGVVDIGQSSSLLLADIPGLIEGASQGKGLGDEFLRHVERTAVLLHLIDVYHDDVVAAYDTILKELKAYNVDLSRKPQIVAFTKVEGLDDDIVESQASLLRQKLPKNTTLFTISSKSGANVNDLLFAIHKKVMALRSHQARVKAKKPSLPVLTIPNDDAWQVTKTKAGFVVTGKKIERFAERTEFTNPHAVQRLRDIMRKLGIMHELSRQGIGPGDKIKISHNTIDY